MQKGTQKTNNFYEKEYVNLQKKFVLDPEVLLRDPYAILSFEENALILPSDTLMYLEEKVNNRNRCEVEKHNAKIALQVLDEIIIEANEANEKGRFKWVPNSEAIKKLKINKDMSLLDSDVIALSSGGWIVLDNSFPMKDMTAIALEYDGIVVSENPAIRIPCAMSQVLVENYRGDVEKTARSYTGREVVQVSAATIDEFYRYGYVDLNTEFEPNTYITLEDSGNPSHVALARFDAVKHLVVSLAKTDMVFGIHPKNVGQRFALDALMNPDIPLVILSGPAGTAKTLLSLAAGLELTKGSEAETYQRILVACPNIKFDETVAFLKGSEAEKVNLLIRGIMDNMGKLTESKVKYAESKSGTKKDRTPISDDESTNKIAAPNSYVQNMIDNQEFVIQAMKYMRGGSISSEYIIVDEAQNITREQAFRIVSRVGEGTKIILEGDPAQIDTSGLSLQNNGLTWVAEQMKGSLLCAQVSFEEKECVRSPLAKEAVRLLSTQDIKSLLDTRGL